MQSFLESCYTDQLVCPGFVHTFWLLWVCQILDKLLRPIEIRRDYVNLGNWESRHCIFYDGKLLSHVGENIVTENSFMNMIEGKIVLFLVLSVTLYSPAFLELIEEKIREDENPSFFSLLTSETVSDVISQLCHELKRRKRRFEHLEKRLLSLQLIHLLFEPPWQYSTDWFQPHKAISIDFNGLSFKIRGLIRYCAMHTAEHE